MFLVGFPIRKPTSEFAQKSKIEVGNGIVFCFRTSGVQKCPYCKFIYPYVCMYVFMYVWTFPTVKATGRNFERNDLKFAGYVKDD